MTLTVLSVERATRIATTFDQPEAIILQEIKDRRSQKLAEMARFGELCDRFDNLYYPNVIHPTGGADHWPNDVSATTPGRVHISLNVYQNYVDIPASLQSVEPIENILAINDMDDHNRTIAEAVERTYFAWKTAENFEMKAHRACVVKGLYGRTAAKVYWDERTKRPCFTVVDQPRNLWLGWATDEYERLDWAMYSYRISLTEAIAKYSLDLGWTEMDEVKDGKQSKIRLPFFRARNSDVINESPNMRTRDWISDEQFMVECVDYWYRKPKQGASGDIGEPTEMETWNAIFVGNFLVKDMPHPEYDGEMPYVPLNNTYIPGVPEGRSELFDIEQIIREKDERISAGGQVIRKAVAGQYWQLTGPDAPEDVPLGLKPKEDTVVAPGAGNRIESINPYIPTFDLMSYLDRLDRELEDVSGLNELLRGLAPAQVLSSGKAINALVANYEMRIRMKRELFYAWRVAIWELARVVWANKDPLMGKAFGVAGIIDVKAPSITPRDDIETATMALNLLNGRVWSLSRAQDYTGVDDTESETARIREDRTDASLFPESVTQQVGLMATLQQMGAQQQQQQPGQPGMSPGQQANAQRQQQGGFNGSPMMNGAGEQIQTPPGAQPPGPGGIPQSGPGQNFVAQTAINGQGANSRILVQQPIAPQGGGNGGS